MPAIHSAYLKQFQRYYRLMRVRTHMGLASEDSYFQSVPFLSEKEGVGKSDMMRGCCMGFGLCLGYMKEIGQEAWWNEMLDHVENWDGTYESLKSMVALPSAREQKQMLLSGVFERVMAFVIGIQEGLRATLRDNYDEVVAGREQEYIARNGQVKRMSTVIHMHGQFTKEMLKKLLTMSDFKSLLSSKHVILLLVGADHAVHLGYDGKTWEYADINIERGAYVSSDLNIIVNVIAKQLGDFLAFHMMPVRPQLHDLMSQIKESFSDSWFEESELFKTDSLSCSDTSLTDDHQHTLDALAAIDNEIIESKHNPVVLSEAHSIFQDSVDRSIVCAHEDISEIMANFVKSLSDEQCFQLISWRGLPEKREMEFMTSHTADWVPLALTGAVRWFNEHVSQQADNGALGIRAQLERLRRNIFLMGNKTLIACVAAMNTRMAYLDFVEAKEMPGQAWKDCPELLLNCMLEVNIVSLGYDNRGEVGRAFKANREKQKKWFVDEEGDTFVDFTFAEFLVLHDQEALLKLIKFVEETVGSPKDRLDFMNSVLSFSSVMNIELSDAILNKIQACVAKENKPELVSKSSATLYGGSRTKDRRRGLGPADAHTLPPVIQRK